MAPYALGLCALRCPLCTQVQELQEACQAAQARESDLVHRVEQALSWFFFEHKELF